MNFLLFQNWTREVNTDHESQGMKNSAGSSEDESVVIQNNRNVDIPATSQSTSKKSRGTAKKNDDEQKFGDFVELIRIFHFQFR